ncbi:FecR family protein [Terrimonas pollutisoli]|uniref:FecR family protein n=1 Tax=Terrimonas pollutisoli TaxID=3034147 RepID=UPI0023EB0E77|nr:FecR domain-containing protein [Terrimonas sp. H1YJ31]
MMKHSYEQVFELFMEKLSGNLSPEDEKYVEKMLADDASFSEVWHTLEEESRTLKAGSFLEHINVGDDLHMLKQRINGAEKPRNKLFSLKKALAVAAGFLLIVTGAYFTFFRNEKIVDKEKIAAAVKKNRQSVSLVLADGKAFELSKESSAETIALDNGTINTDDGTLQYSAADTMQNTLSVPVGENYKIVLSDGTEVWLNAATRLRFPSRFYGRQREVYVEGEAYFKVAKDVAHPFIVHTELTQVQVLGTSFNINTYEAGNVKTALVEGKVLTKSNDGKSMELTPGYAADYEVTKGFVSGVFDEDDVLSWINGVYYFHNIPVADLAVAASRCYGIKIVLNKNDFAGRSITGLLDKNKLTDFLNDLKTTAQIDYYYSGNELYLK